MAKNFIVRLRTGGYTGNIVANSQVITYNTGASGSILDSDFVPTLTNLRGTVTTGSNRIGTFTLTMAGGTTTTTTTTTAAPGSPTYRFTAPLTSANTVNEGSSINFTFESNNVPAGTYSYRLFSSSANVASNADVSGGTLTGLSGLLGNITTSITSGNLASNTFAITAVADSLTEGIETFYIRVYNSYANALTGSGTVVTTGYLAESNVVTINDTSTGTTTTTSTTTSTTTTTTAAPGSPTYVFTAPAAGSSVNEGSNITFTFDANNVGGTATYTYRLWSNPETADYLDITGNLIGNVTSSLLSGTVYRANVTITANADVTTEPTPENFYMKMYNSYANALAGFGNATVTTGQLAASQTVTINDTSQGTTTTIAPLTLSSVSATPTTISAGDLYTANIVLNRATTGAVNVDLYANVVYSPSAEPWASNINNLYVGTATVGSGASYVVLGPNAINHVYAFDGSITLRAQANTSTPELTGGPVSTTVTLLKDPFHLLTLQANVSTLSNSAGTTPWSITSRLNRPNFVSPTQVLGINHSLVALSEVFAPGAPSTWYPTRQLYLYHENTAAYPSVANGANVAVLSISYPGTANVGENFYFSGTVTNYMSWNGSAWRAADLSVNNPDLYLVRGATYVFNIDSAVPFHINTSVAGTNYANVSRLGNVDTSGTNNGLTTGNIVFTVPWDAPSTLVYTNAANTVYGNLIVGNVSETRLAGITPFGNVLITA